MCPHQTLFHYVNASLPSHVQADDGGISNCTSSCDPSLPPCAPCSTRYHATRFADFYPYDEWFSGQLAGGAEVGDPSYWFGDHFTLRDSFAARWHGRVFAMFREPARRAVSLYNHGIQGFAENNFTTSVNETNFQLVNATDPPHSFFVSITEYAEYR